MAHRNQCQHLHRTWTVCEIVSKVLKLPRLICSFVLFQLEQVSNNNFIRTKNALEIKKKNNIQTKTIYNIFELNQNKNEQQEQNVKQTQQTWRMNKKIKQKKNKFWKRDYRNFNKLNTTQKIRVNIS